MKKRVDLPKAENTLLPMVKKSYLYSLLSTMVLIFPLLLFCQTPVADSLLKLLPYEKNDSIRIAMLRDIGFDYYRTNAVKSTRYLKEAIALAKQTNNTYQYFGAWMDYGSLKIDMEQYDSAAIIFKWLLPEPFAETNSRMKAGALSNLATVYLDQDKYVEAEQYFLKAIDIYEKNKIESQLVNSYGNICFIYTDLKQYQNTINYAGKLYAIAKKINGPQSLVVALSFLSASYTRLGQPEKAIAYLNEAMALSLQQQNPSQRFELHSDFGEYYIAIKEYNKAIIQLTKADSISKILTNSRHRGGNLALLGKAYTLKKDYAKAREVLEQAALLLSANGKMVSR
jgi:tetratricopeptide (TPR) repeat protein